MKVVILGNTILGRILADSLESSLIVDPSYETASDLIRRYGRDRVLVGEPMDDRTLLHAGVETAETVVVTTGNDARNLSIAQKIRGLSRCRLIVEASDPVNVQVLNEMGFEDVFSPSISAAQEVLALVRPESHHVSDLYVAEGSPLKGKRVGDLFLPKGVVVAGLMRQNHLVSPSQNEVLSKGDHLVLYSSSGAAPIETLVADSRAEMRPFSQITLLLDESKESESMVREMASLAKDIGFSLRLASNRLWCLESARQVAASWNVPFKETLLEGGALLNPKKTVRSLELNDECLAISMTESTRKGFFSRRRVNELISSIPGPIIISRGSYPHHRFLALVDVSWKDSKIAEIAAKMAIVGKAELDLLRDAESAEAVEETSHIRRLARSYGVQVQDIAIEGNPTVELVSMIKSGRYDMVALDWGCKMLKKDIFQRIIFESPISVLVRGRSVCELPFRP